MLNNKICLSESSSEPDCPVGRLFCCNEMKQNYSNYFRVEVLPAYRQAGWFFSSKKRIINYFAEHILAPAPLAIGDSWYTLLSRYKRRPTGTSLQYSIFNTVKMSRRVISIYFSIAVTSCPNTSGNHLIIYYGTYSKASIWGWFNILIFVWPHPAERFTLLADSLS